MKSIERLTGACYRGATTVLTWIRREDEPNDALVYGTQRGFLVCWRQSSSKRLLVNKTPYLYLFLLTNTVDSSRKFNVCSL